MESNGTGERRSWPGWLYWWLAVWTVGILMAVGYFGYYIWCNGPGAAMGREGPMLTRAASHDNDLFPSRAAMSATPPAAASAIPAVASATSWPMPTGVPSPTAMASPTPAPPLAEGPRGLPMESPEYGMQAFLWWRPETAHRDLGMIREAGFGWVKQNFAWRDIELAKGVFDWSVTDRIMDQIDEF
ncbi:MAG: hypothetical protein HPY83_12150, partial [Anaerolineae bacterium]|nr:hypothetical protein [Anaerolineae bacterium]